MDVKVFANDVDAEMAKARANAPDGHIQIDLVHACLREAVANQPRPQFNKNRNWPTQELLEVTMRQGQACRDGRIDDARQLKKEARRLTRSAKKQVIEKALQEVEGEFGTKPIWQQARAARNFPVATATRPCKHSVHAFAGMLQTRFAAPPGNAVEAAERVRKGDFLQRRDRPHGGP